MAADVQFASDRTCCICREPGKSIVIHHIDENPANNSPDNLAVVCLQCHDDTQTKGGFGRHLDAAQVRRYKQDWLERVAARRRRADEIAVEAMLGIKQVRAAPETRLDLINSLPIIRLHALRVAQSRWDTGVTSTMLQASYDYISVLEGMLVRLGKLYPADHFADPSPRRYFAEYIADRFAWHRARLEPEGAGTGGTIVGVITAGDVQADAEVAIEQMVQVLAENLTGFQLKRWRRRWHSSPRKRRGDA